MGLLNEILEGAGLCRLASDNVLFFSHQQELFHSRLCCGQPTLPLARVLALQPRFGIGEFCAVNDPAPEIAAPMSEALRAAGLPP